MRKTRGRVAAILLSICMALSMLPGMGLTAFAAEPEAMNLTVGGTYWFDLSGKKDDMGGTVNANLPDTDMNWVPFTYAGTVNAYTLDSGSSGKTNASQDVVTNLDSTYGYVSNHSLFISDYDLTNVSWNNLNAVGLIFGTNYRNGDVDYILRAPSVGSNEIVSTGQVTPENNEWDAILAKGINIKNAAITNQFSWGQDTAETNQTHRSVRKCTGYTYNTVSADSATGASNIKPYYRPVLEVSSLSVGDVKAVTVNLNGGRIGTSNETSVNIIAASDTAYEPGSEGLTHPDGKEFDGWTREGDIFTANWKEDHVHSGTPVEKVSATCTVDGTKAYYACSCGAKFEDAACTKEIADFDTWKVISKLGHDFSVQQYSETQHWMKCSRCEVTDVKENHNYGDDNICDSCGYKKSEETKPEEPKPEEDTYKITEGANQSIIENFDGTVTIKCNGELGKFVSVSVDGKLVDSKYYTVKSGSTILTFSKEYLDSLSVGEHKVRFNYTDGFAETELTVKKVGANEGEVPAGTEKPDNQNKPVIEKIEKEGAPKTADNSPIVWMAILVMASAAVVVTAERRRKNL